MCCFARICGSGVGTGGVAVPSLLRNNASACYRLNTYDAHKYTQTHTNTYTGVMFLLFSITAYFSHAVGVCIRPLLFPTPPFSCWWRHLGLCKCTHRQICFIALAAIKSTGVSAKQNKVNLTRSHTALTVISVVTGSSFDAHKIPWFCLMFWLTLLKYTYSQSY